MLPLKLHLPSWARRPRSAPHATTWEPAFWNRLPLSGALALLGSVLCTFANIAVLASSDGVQTGLWPSSSTSVEPAVVIAIITAISNSLVQYSLYEGAAVTWWSLALKGASFADFHRYWKYAESLPASLLAGRHFNKLALACITATIVLLDGPLLQRASTVVDQKWSGSVNVTLDLNPGPLPQDYSGQFGLRGGLVTSLSPNFSAVVRDYNNRQPIVIGQTGCSGTCTGEVVAPGWDVSCIESSVPYNYTQVVSGDQIGFKKPKEVGGIDLGFDDASTISLIVKYKASPTCAGNLTVRNCTLRAGSIKHDIQLLNNTISLSNETMVGNRTTKLYPLEVQTGSMGTWPSTWGGFWLALDHQFGSSITVDFSGAYQLEGKGVMQYLYGKSGLEIEEMESGGCPWTWSDPSDDIYSMLQELTFRSAVQQSTRNLTNPKQVILANNVFPVIIYHSSYAFLAIAIAIQFVAWVTLVPLFYGWWLIGRKVSLSPIEIGKAFRTPLLRHTKTGNGNVQALLEETGDMRVQYGIVHATKDYLQTEPLTTNASDPFASALPMSTLPPDRGIQGPGDTEQSASDGLLRSGDSSRLMLQPDMSNELLTSKKYFSSYEQVYDQAYDTDLEPEPESRLKASMIDREVLGFATPQLVRRPRKGAVYPG